MGQVISCDITIVFYSTETLVNCFANKVDGEIINWNNIKVYNALKEFFCYNFRNLNLNFEIM